MVDGSRVHSENVFVGISLAKQLTIEGVRSAVALARTDFAAHRVLFLLADELEFINLRTLDPAGSVSLQRRVDRRAAALEETIKAAMSQEFTAALGWKIARWREILDAGYWKLYTDILALFIEKARFRREVNNVALEFAQRRLGGRNPSAAQLQHLSLYIVAELPTLMQGVRAGAKEYLSMIYPATTAEGLDRLAEGLQTNRFGLRVSKTCAIRKVDLGDVLPVPDESPPDD